MERFKWLLGRSGSGGWVVRYYDPYEFDIATNIKLFHVIECLVLVLVFFGCKKSVHVEKRLWLDIIVGNLYVS